MLSTFFKIFPTFFLLSCIANTKDLISKFIYSEDIQKTRILQASSEILSKNLLVRGYNENPRGDIEILDFNPYEGDYSLSTNMGPSNRNFSREERRYIENSKKKDKFSSTNNFSLPFEQKITSKENFVKDTNTIQQDSKKSSFPKKPISQPVFKKKSNIPISSAPIKTNTRVIDKYISKISEIGPPIQLKKIFNQDKNGISSNKNLERHKKAGFITDTVDVVKGWIKKVPGVNILTDIPEKIKSKSKLEKIKIPISSQSEKNHSSHFKRMLDKGHLDNILKSNISHKNYNGRYYKGIAHYIKSLNRSDPPDIRYKNARTAQKYLRDLQKEKDCPRDILARSRLWFGIITYRCFHSPKDIKEGISFLKKISSDYSETKYCNDAHFYTMLTYAKIGRRKKALQALERMKRDSKKSDLIYDEDYKLWSSHDSVYRFYSKYLENL